MLKAIANHRATQVVDVVPWTIISPREIGLKTKLDFTRWCGNRNTQHVFYSGLVGVNPSSRVSDANQAWLVNALVADFDKNWEEGELDSLFDAWPEATLPTWCSLSFSRGVHAVWLLEKPMIIGHNSLYKAWAKAAIKAMHLEDVLHGSIEKEATIDPFKYYELGTDWCQLVDGPTISNARCHEWLMRASKSHKFDPQEPAIPLDEVEKKIHELYPGRWQGDFKEGSRGIRFWKEDSDGPNNAEVRPNGMVDYVGDEHRFWSWRMIIHDREWVEQFVTNRLGRAIADYWFDGQTYWFFNETSTQWDDKTHQNMVIKLRSAHGLSAEPQEGQGSEIDRALVMVQEQKRLAGAAPFVHRKPGIIHFEGKRILNLYKSNLVMPAEGITSAPGFGDGFPWLANLFELLFETQEQWDYISSHIKRFYRSGYYNQPTQGQAIFLAGPPGQGKTLFTNKILGTLFGSHGDAGDFLTGQTTFNKELFFAPVWAMDDEKVVSSPNWKTMYTSIIKKLTANRTFQYHPKYANPVLVEWFGRIFISCNLDANSLSVLPELGMSNEDKISLFMVGQSTDAEKGFDRDIEQMILEELPYFAAWLFYDPIPDHVVGGTRYGIKAYHHPIVRQEAEASSATHDFRDTLEAFLEEYFKENKKLTEWEGRMTDLLGAMQSEPRTQSVVKNMTSNYLGRLIRMLQTKNVLVTQHTRNGTRVTIPKTILINENYQNGHI